LVGNRLELLHQKIQVCGEELRTEGSSKTSPNTEEVKKLQKKLEKLNMEEISEKSKAEFLGVSKTLNYLLM